MDKAKPFCISRKEVWQAYKRVKANRGAAGVDGVTIEQFELDLENNLYKLWNRMSSGSYFPSMVRRVEIPKADGRMRPLGIPTVNDRIAQMVVKRRLEPEIEPHFHQNSYGYRPGRSAIQALSVARKRCWDYNWALDLDVKGFFDNIDHPLLLKAVKFHTDVKWMILYIERWLKAPVQLTNGQVLSSNKGTPQGGVISPLLANLFLHYTFDLWMDRNCPTIAFERYADDIICHLRSEKQAKWLRWKLEERLKECGLGLHPQKTKIVYCKDDCRAGSYRRQSFDFLGYTFRPRLARTRQGRFFVGFLPAISNKSAKQIRRTIKSWRIHLRSDLSIEDIAQWSNPSLTGWINYFGRFYRSAIASLMRYFDRILIRWAVRKYKRFKGSRKRASAWLMGLRRRDPGLFAHWRPLITTAGQ